MPIQSYVFLFSSPMSKPFRVGYVRRPVILSALPEGTEKKEHGLKGKKKSAIQRLRMSRSHVGKQHSDETKAKISQSMKRRKSKAASADAKSVIDLGFDRPKKREVDYFVMEKAVLELSQLRKEVSLWLQGWYTRYDHKPSLEEVAQLSPEIHNKFLRYIALQEFIRSNS